MKRNPIPVPPLAVAAGLLLAVPGAVAAESGDARTRRIEARIPDVVLVDQDGRKRRFFSDLVKGKLVLMNAIYTDCPGTCPIQTRIFARAQQMLAERFGDRLQIISVSLDPVTDTPERLAAFAKKFDAGPGWVFLTGPRPDVVRVLKAMDLYAADPRAHTPICVVGDEAAGVWMKAINLTSPVALAKRLEFVASQKVPPVGAR